MSNLGHLKIIAFTAGLGLTACQPASSPNTENKILINQGKIIAEQNCASCHTLESTGISPRPDAPPMRTVLSQYNTVSLADDFREHIHVGHPDMPDFDFSVKEIDSLIAYLESIQDPKRVE